MNKNLLILPISIALFSTAAFSTVLAQYPTPKPTEYKLLEPIPQLLKQNSTDSTDTATFIPGLFRLAISLATGLAVLMLIYGGIQYMSTDAWGEKNEAKGTIQNAIVGLLLTLSAWLIIATINPQLVKFDLNIERIEMPQNTNQPGSGGTGRVMTPSEIAADVEVRRRIQDANILINAGPCLQGQTSGCTNLNGLGEGAIQGLIGLKSDCGACVVRVTGGTEPGAHRTHGVGRSIVDLGNEASLRSWLGEKGFLINNGNGAVVQLSNGRRVSFVFERAGQGNSTGDHWHVVF